MFFVIAFDWSVIPSNSQLQSDQQDNYYENDTKWHDWWLSMTPHKPFICSLDYKLYT